MDVVALEVEGYVLERPRIPVDVESPDSGVGILAVLLSRFYLTLEVLGEV
jgi:hypothetical protein